MFFYCGICLASIFQIQKLSTMSVNGSILQQNRTLARNIKYLIQTSELAKMWNDFLHESRSQHKFQNTNVIILGSRHSGKRSLIDSLFDISKTTINSKRLSAHIDTNRMRLKGLTTAIDYAYLNVLDLNDPDYRTYTKLQIYMIEENQTPEIFKEISNPQILKKSVIVIMLDFTSPWNFMAELQKWVKFIYQLQQNAGFSIGELDQMKGNVQDHYRGFKEPEFDQFGKLKRNFGLQGEERIEIPIPDGTLINNLRIPLIVCVNKCDLQSGVLRDDSASKIMFVMYQLRKFCLQYGGTLIYTSIRNNCNLDILYEYILHRAYKMPLRFKSELINEQAIFIPLGFDNPTLLSDSTMKMDVSKPFEEVIPAPAMKKNIKPEILVEDDSRYFQKYAMMGLSSASQSTISQSQRSNAPSIDSSNGSLPNSENVTKFFEVLMNKKNNAEKTLEKKVFKVQKEDQKREDDNKDFKM